ncbi:MAG: peptidylprolyl isomerase [Methylophilaceae bacterium]
MMSGKLSVKRHVKNIFTLFLLFITLPAFSGSLYKIETNKGDIVIETYADKAPISVKNFENYVKAEFFNGTIFHRVIDGFMIQGGGFDKTMNQKETMAPIKNEAANGLKNTKYTVAMARTSIPDSATSQFFINVADNGFLDYPGQDGAGYCVFGKVVEGMNVVDDIAKVPTATKKGHENVPIRAITIKNINKLN